MKNLNDILININPLAIIGNSDIPINKIVFDSREIEHGCLFAAIKGTQVDGHKYIDNALKSGAIAIICEELPQNKPEHICFVQVSNSGFSLGMLADAFYNFPSSKIKLIGVTGTNGKSTIVSLLHNLFLELGYKTGLLSTIQNIIHTQIIPSTHTTPDAVKINELLNKMVEKGVEYCFMEVSSHSIDQERIAGLNFAGGVFTNLTHDHLDYHSTFDHYLKTKKRLFDDLPKEAFALTNSDDEPTADNTLAPIALPMACENIASVSYDGRA